MIRSRGFTIVELLIVVVVIAILAAITIVSYNGIQNRAYDSSVQNDLENIAKQYEMYKAQSGANLYPYGSTLSDGIAFRININKSAYDLTASYQLLNCTSSSSASYGTIYAMLALSRSGKKYYVSSASGGVKEYTGSSSWLTQTSCTDVLAGSDANGAGYSSSTWRTWTSAS
jgi:prepilin-type N-terminal cleavage/methylation domain-containing protein